MLEQKELWRELENFYIVQNETATVPLIDKDFSKLLNLAKERTKAEQPYVAASILMRHAAFLFTAQLYILSKYRVKWTGDLAQVRIVNRTLDDRWAPQWSLSGGKWIPVETEKDVKEIIKRMICHDCRMIVKAVAAETNSSPLVLWENIWGYILWMYVQLLNQGDDISSRARDDLEFLLDSATWKGIERHSPFQRFLNGQTPEEAMAHYARVTCCYYYKIPGNDRCSYCPKNQKD
jgi:ferric iron reductase protein FhuF